MPNHVRNALSAPRGLHLATAPHLLTARNRADCRAAAAHLPQRHCRSPRWRASTMACRRAFATCVAPPPLTAKAAAGMLALRYDFIFCVAILRLGASAHSLVAAVFLYGGRRGAGMAGPPLLCGDKRGRAWAAARRADRQTVEAAHGERRTRDARAAKQQPRTCGHGGGRGRARGCGLDLLLATPRHHASAYRLSGNNAPLPTSRGVALFIFLAIEYRRTCGRKTWVSA